MRDKIVEVGSHVDLRRVAAIGIAGMAESGCLIEARDRPITPMLLWHDRRGIRQAAALRRKAGDDFARLTGLRTTSVRSISKWKWMVDHGAPREPREARWCVAPEWIALRLTGRWQTDATLAVRTGACPLKDDYDALLRKMTLQEKVGQMRQVTIDVVSKKGEPHALDPAKLEDAVVRHAVGSILNVGASA